MRRTLSKLVESTSAALVIFLLAKQARLLIRYDPMEQYWWTPQELNLHLFSAREVFYR